MICISLFALNFRMSTTAPVCIIMISNYRRRGIPVAHILSAPISGSLRKCHDRPEYDAVSWSATDHTRETPVSHCMPKGI